MRPHEYTALWGPMHKEILQHLADGLTIKQIAECIHRGRSTVERHLEAMREDVKCKTIIQLVAYAIRNEIVD